MKAIPTGWERTTIADLCSFGSGTGFGPSNWSTDGWPIIRIQNLNGSTDFNYFAGEPDPAWIVEPGELLFAWAGVKGVSFGPTIWRGSRGVLNQHIYRIRATAEVHLEWLYLQLLHVTALIEAQAHGFKSSLVHVRKSDITSQICYRPLFAEQKAIAVVLSAWDRGIRQLTDLIAAKLSFKQGLTQELLTGERRLKTVRHSGRSELVTADVQEDSLVSLEVEFGLTGRSFKDGIPSIGSCPSGWTQHSFRDLFEIVERPAELRDDIDYQLVTAKRYRGGIVPREQLRGEQIKTKTQFYVAGGDFLISKRQIIHGACGMVPASLDGAVVSNEYACLQPSCHLDPRFLNYLTHTRYFQQTCFHASVGVALEKMIFRLDQWLKHHVNLPPLEEQRAIAHFLSTMDREILLLARERRLLKEQKKGLMQKLLTGEVRVKMPKGVS